MDIEGLRGLMLDYEDTFEESFMLDGPATDIVRENPNFFKNIGENYTTTKVDWSGFFI